MTGRYRDLLTKRQDALEAYEADYRFAQAPICPTVRAVPRDRQRRLRRAGLAHGVQGVVAEHDAMASEESPRAARHPPPAQLGDQRILFRRVCVHGAAIRKGGKHAGTVPRAYAVPVGRVAALRREARSSHLERG